MPRPAEGHRREEPGAAQTWPTVKAGLHFLIPFGMLIWCLMIEELSPALSAYWATITLSC